MNKKWVVQSNSITCERYYSFTGEDDVLVWNEIIDNAQLFDTHQQAYLFIQNNDLVGMTHVRSHTLDPQRERKELDSAWDRAMQGI